MKKVLFVAALILTSFASQAQLSADIAAYRAILATHFACSTAGCRTKSIEAAEADSLYGLLLRIEAEVSAAGDLDGVLGVGNTSDQDIILDDGSYKVIYSTDNIAWMNGSTLLGQILSNYSGAFAMAYKDPASINYAFIKAGSQSTSHMALLPDEGDGAGLDATLVLHTTKDDITVTNGTNEGIYGSIQCSVDDGIGGNLTLLQPSYAGVQNTGITTVDLLKHYANYLEYDYTNSVGSVAHVARLHFDRAFTGSSTQDLYMPSQLHTNDTFATLSDVTAANQNIANASLRWNGAYTQHVNKKPIVLDSALDVIITDTLHNTLFDASTGNKAVNVLHLSSNSGTPTIDTGAAGGAGVLATVSITGSDLAGNLTITTGTSPNTNAIAAVISFNHSYATAPKCIELTPANAATIAITPNSKLVLVDAALITTNDFSITTGSTALSASTTYKWYYHVIQ